MSTVTMLPFEKQIVCGKMINADLVMFVYLDETTNAYNAVLVKKYNEAGDVEIGASLEFEQVGGTDWTIWTDETTKDAVVVYKPKVPYTTDTKPDRALLIKFEDIKFTEHMFANVDRSEELQLSILWMFKNGMPADIDNSSSQPGAGSKPVVTYDDDGNITGVTVDGKEAKIVDKTISTPMEDRYTSKLRKRLKGGTSPVIDIEPVQE